MCDHASELILIRDVIVAALENVVAQSMARLKENGNTCAACTREKVHLFAALCASPTLAKASTAVNETILEEMIRLTPGCNPKDIAILVSRWQQLQAEAEGVVPPGVDLESLNFELSAASL